jgi:hypothetical protein
MGLHQNVPILQQNPVTSSRFHSTLPLSKFVTRVERYHMYIPSDLGVPVWGRALVKHDVITLAVEGRRDEKEDAACTRSPVLLAYVTNQPTGWSLGRLQAALVSLTGYTVRVVCQKTP